MAGNKTKLKAYLITSGMVLFVLCLLSLYLGPAKMHAKDFFAALCDVKKNTPFGIIVYSVRLPRIAAAVAAGAGLGISGTILQSVTGNKMASPNLIGVSSGAGFAVILSLSLFPRLFDFVPLFAFIGAFLSALFITVISRRIGLSKGTVILTGLAFGSVLSAGISLLSLLDTDVLVSYNAFSIGSLSGVEFSDLYLPAVMVFSVFVLTLFMSKKIDILSLSRAYAHSLGLNVRRTMIFALLLASASAAAAVSFSGLLGFVGLMAPHIARQFVPENTRTLVPCSALTGAILVLCADLAGRTLFSPSELPAGIFLSLLGAPFFLFLLISKGGKNNA